MNTSTNSAGSDAYLNISAEVRVIENPLYEPSVGSDAGVVVMKKSSNSDRETSGTWKMIAIVLGAISVVFALLFALVMAGTITAGPCDCLPTLATSDAEASTGAINKQPNASSVRMPDLVVECDYSVLQSRVDELEEWYNNTATATPPATTTTTTTGTTGTTTTATTTSTVSSTSITATTTSTSTPTTTTATTMTTATGTTKTTTTTVDDNGIGGSIWKSNFNPFGEQDANLVPLPVGGLSENHIRTEYPDEQIATKDAFLTGNFEITFTMLSHATSLNFGVYLNGQDLQDTNLGDDMEKTWWWDQSNSAGSCTNNPRVCPLHQFRYGQGMVTSMPEFDYQYGADNSQLDCGFMITLPKYKTHAWACTLNDPPAKVAYVKITRVDGQINFYDGGKVVHAFSQIETGPMHFFFVWSGIVGAEVMDLKFVI